MEQYLKVKRAAQQSFIDHGATLSHHHAVGTEHLPWLAADISPLGVNGRGGDQAGPRPGQQYESGTTAAIRGSIQGVVANRQSAPGRQQKQRRLLLTSHRISGQGPVRSTLMRRGLRCTRTVRCG